MSEVQPVPAQGNPAPVVVTVVNFDMPFGDMVSMWMKVTFSALVAWALLTVILGFAGGFLWALGVAVFESTK